MESKYDRDVDIFSKLRRGCESFPPQQRKICAYILDNHREAAFMTIEQMAQALSVGPATIIRTVQNLGYDSFKKFLPDLRSTVITEESTYWKSLRQSWEAGEDLGPDGRLAGITRQNIFSLENSLSEPFLQSFKTAVSLMRSARKILILGLRSSRAASYYLYFMLHEFVGNVSLADAVDSDDIYSDIIQLDKEDVFLAFSLGGPNYAAKTLEAVMTARGRKCSIILIADTPKNPAAQYADALLPVSPPASHYSLVPVMNLLDSFIAEMGIVHDKTRMAELAAINRKRNIVM